MSTLTDIRLFETGNGGDLKLNGNDLAKCYTFENMPYIGMFGGNPSESTPTDRVNEEKAFDYWGNALFFPQNKEVQFNSQTERVLYDVQLNSRGRILVENAVKEDLKFMQPFAEVNVLVNLIAIDNIEISIKIIQPDNGVERQFLYIWDGVLLIEDDKSFSDFVKPATEGLDEIFDFELI